MTVSTIYADSTDGKVSGFDASSYAVAAGGGDPDMNAGQAVSYVGQVYTGAAYICYELFFQFDTSIIGTNEISSVVFSLDCDDDLSTTDFTCEARLHDWGTSLATGDFVVPASMAGKTLLATLASAGIGSGYSAFTDVAFVANINKTGYTRIVVVSSRHRGANAPTGEERLGFQMVEAAGNKPKLVITHAPAAVAAAPDPMGMFGIFGS